MGKYDYSEYKLKRRFIHRILIVIVLLVILWVGLPKLASLNIFTQVGNVANLHINKSEESRHPIHYLQPKYEEGDTHVVVNNNIPVFSNEDLVDLTPYTHFSQLDDLQRVGVADAVLNQELMPDKVREDISHVKPSGWNQREVLGNYLYHRSHLIGFQLTGENDNPRNLMTGTRFFNVEGMLPFENYVANYLEEDPDHYVRYRITPLFHGRNLLASGVFMEAFSLDDNGESIQFHVFIPNYLPGRELNYLDGTLKIDSIMDWLF